MDFIWCIFIILVGVSRTSGSDTYEEKLTIQSTKSGHVISTFHFSLQTDSVDEFRFYLFPLQFAELVSLYRVQELHVSLTRGHWRHQLWGLHQHAPSSGAQLWVWLHPHIKSVSNVWRGLVNALSGLMCASFNFMDPAVTSSPKFSFRPEGVVAANQSDSGRSRLFFSSLPHETVCTENLTPLLKLLPCGSHAGLATLLTPTKLFNSHYHSLSLKFYSVCKSSDCSTTVHQLQLTFTIVHQQQQQRRSGGELGGRWSLKSLFGSGLFSTCSVASKSELLVDTRDSQIRPFSLTPPPTSTVSVQTPLGTATYASYNLTELLATGAVNIGAIYEAEQELVDLASHSVPLSVSQYQTGVGYFSVGINIQVTNHHSSVRLPVLVLLVVPWYLRVYLHTLHISDTSDRDVTPLQEHYVPAISRVRPVTVELLFTVPPRDTVTVTVHAQRQFLKWHEYPPDASHGIYIPSATVSAALAPPTDHNGNYTLHSLVTSRESGSESTSHVFVRLFTENLLISLPVPDFSMPYNVICLVCTVVALAFGPLHNITTKRLTLRVIDNRPILDKLKDRLRLMFCKQQQQQKPETSNEQTADIAADTKEE